MQDQNARKGFTKAGRLYLRVINKHFEDGLHFESTFVIAQCGTESLKKLDDDTILLLTAEVDEEGERKIRGCLKYCLKA